MTFSWKKHGEIFKGSGIYFLTFAVSGRRPLLGKLVEMSDEEKREADVARQYRNDRRTDEERNLNTNGRSPVERAKMVTSQTARIRLSPLGFEVAKDLKHIGERYEGVRILAKQIMEDHIHVVLYLQKDTKKSIRQIGHGFRIGITHIAQDMNLWPKMSPASIVDTQQCPTSSVVTHEECHSSPGAGLILDQPFIRTLSHRGQLDAMIKYTHANPDNAWMRRLHPDLYVIRRNIEINGLHFDTMGKDRLITYPDRQVIALSRSLTDEMIEKEVAHALYRAERGTITYTAAINEGEKAVSKAIRHHAYPLVVMLLDGFPPEGTEQAKYFHPNGVYHTACGEGHLLLLAPHSSNYTDPRVITLTEEELRHKAELKHQSYTPIPHTSKRWRMIAGNVMLKMVGGEGDGNGNISNR